jgi:hypothetical protein
MKPIEGRTFVCKRCGRQYAYPEPGERPIRCECGWWYVNESGRIRETYWQRIEPYREPEDVAKIFR